MTLSIETISAVNLARALRWHPRGLEDWSLSDWACALSGEVGELCNVVKKLNRVRDSIQGSADPGGEALRHQLADEIGDVYAYLDLLAQRAGLDLATCARSKFNRVSEREGFPERL